MGDVATWRLSNTHPYQRCDAVSTSFDPPFHYVDSYLRTSPLALLYCKNLIRTTTAEAHMYVRSYGLSTSQSKACLGCICDHACPLQRACSLPEQYSYGPCVERQAYFLEYPHRDPRYVIKTPSSVVFRPQGVCAKPQERIVWVDRLNVR